MPIPNEEPFDPLSQTVIPLGQGKTATALDALRTLSLREAEALAKHFQLTERGTLRNDESQQHMGRSKRRTKIVGLHEFPPAPPKAKEAVERFVATYGLPLQDLSSDTAAFILRRVMYDYFRLAILRRQKKEPLFTPDELIELMRVMRLKPFQLAEFLSAGDPKQRNSLSGLIHRWMHGASRPVGVRAMRVNRLIEQQVRRPRSQTGGTARYKTAGEYSTNPESVRRRLAWLRRKERGKELIPIAKSALQEEGNDAG
jgi:hypothetical protein